MPQTFQVLRCYKCAVFQVHPTKKANKWNCKLCGEKQLIKRFYGLGTGKECRLHVQKLNGIRGELDSQCNTDTEDLNTVSDSSDPPEQDDVPTHPIAKKSKWLDYLDPNTQEQQQSPDETMHLNNIEVVLELPKKLARKRKNVIGKTSKIQNVTESSLENYSVPTRVLNNHTMNNAMNPMESDRTSRHICPSKPSNITHNKFIPPPEVINSRWAHFVEPQKETQSSNDENDIDSNIQVLKSAEAVFPFLEDEDLDSILAL